MRKTARVVAISNYVRSAAEDQGVPHDRISLIYNLAPSTVDEGTSSPPVLAPGYDALVYVGAISEQKGLLQLVEAFAKVHRSHPRLCLWIVGGSRWGQDFLGQLKDKILQLGIAEGVLFAGQVQNPSAWYAAASIHLAPSICAEALGNVVMEAKVGGTPSIVFPSGGLPEMIRHQTDGFICEEKTSESLAEAIDWMLGDRDRLATMGRSAYDDSLGRFGKERFLHEWAQVYLETLTEEKNESN